MFRTALAPLADWGKIGRPMANRPSQGALAGVSVPQREDPKICLAILANLRDQLL